MVNKSLEVYLIFQDINFIESVKRYRRDIENDHLLTSFCSEEEPFCFEHISL